MSVLYYFKTSLGWRNWAVFTYNGFLENIFIAFYIALITKDYTNQFIINLLFFYLFSIFSTSYGYLINDLADRDLDIQHGKENTFKNVSSSKATLVVILVLIVSAFFAIPFVTHSYFLVLWVIWFLSATFYSIKPVRLKERGKLGLIIVVGAQRLIPTLLVFAAFQYHHLFDVFLFSIYTLTRGLSSDINHQLEDYWNDHATTTKTFAVQKGYSRAQNLFHWVLEIEKILFLVILIKITHVFFVIYPHYWFIPATLALFYLICYGISIYYISNNSNRNPFIQYEKNIFQFIHHPFPTIILPMILVIILLSYNINYLFIVAVFILSKRIFKKETIVNNFLVINLKRGVLGWIKK